MDTSKPIEWQQIKSGWLGYQGAQLLCIVEKEDLPVEGYAPNILQDVFTTPEAAMAKGELILHRISNHEREHDQPPKPSWIVTLIVTLLPLLKSMVQILEAGVPQLAGTPKMPPGATHQMLYQSKANPTMGRLCFLIDGRVESLMTSGKTEPFTPGDDWILKSTLDVKTGLPLLDSENNPVNVARLTPEAKID